MRGKWASRIGWTFLVLFVLAASEKNSGAAVIFLTGVVVYWAKRIETAIKSLKE
jgi:hypothetical protein